LGHAAAGDTAYRERDFTGATAEYQLALDQLLELEASLPGRIEALHDTLLSGDRERRRARPLRRALASWPKWHPPISG
jgi:hypothetical protein